MRLFTATGRLQPYLAGVSSCCAFTEPVKAIHGQIDSGVYSPYLGPVLPLHLLRLHVLPE